MSFAYPAVLYALPLVALPILIHLWNRRRYQPQLFGAMRFLEEAMRKTRKRLLLEDWLLLLLRTLAILALIVALAGPGASAPDAISKQARTEILILDASLSMQHKDEKGQMAYHQAVQQARAQLRGMKQAHGDSAILVLAGARPTVLAAGSPENVRQSLASIPEAEQGHARWAQAIRQALQAYSLLDRPSHPVTMSLISDFQATSWAQTPSLQQAIQDVALAGFSIQNVHVGAANRANRALTQLETEPQLLYPGDPALIQTTIRNFSEAPLETEISLHLDGVPLARKPIQLKANQEFTWSHPFQAPQSGTHTLIAHTPSDALAQDDAFPHIIQVQEPIDILVVGHSSQDGAGVHDVLLRYLGPSDSQSIWKVTSLSPEAIQDTHFQEAKLCILADPYSLPNATLEALSAHIQKGLNLLVLLGPQIQAETLQALHESLAGCGAPPLENAGLAFSTQLDIQDPNHPALALFKDPRWRPLLTEIPFAKHHVLKAPDWDAPLAFQNGHPALLEFKLATSQLAFLAATPTPTWNRMEEIPGATLPFLFDLIRWMGNANPIQNNYTLGDSLPLSRIARHPSVLHSPAGVPQTWAKGHVDPIPNLTGIWKLSQTTETASSDLQSELAFAFTPPSAESNLSLLSPSLLEALFPSSPRLTAPSANPRQPLRVVAHPWPWFLAFLVLLIAESLFAYSIDSRRAS